MSLVPNDAAAAFAPADLEPDANLGVHKDDTRQGQDEKLRLPEPMPASPRRQPAGSDVPREEEQEEIVAVETSLEHAGEILADLVQSGAALRDCPLSPEISRQLEQQFRASQSVVSEQRESDGALSLAESNENEKVVRKSKQLQIEDILRARAGVAGQRTNQADAQQSEVVFVNPELRKELYRAGQGVTPQRPGEMRLSNLALSDAIQAAQQRQFNGLRIPHPASDSPETSDAEATAQVGQQVRLYLWVRAAPNDGTTAAPPQ